MQQTLFELTRGYKSLSIIGMSKNAGKTTALGSLIKQIGQNRLTLGLTSIGRDGESSDIVTGTKKPGIFVHSGTLIATAEQLLRQSDITREIIETTGINTPMGQVVLFRALSDGNVQIAGPSITTQLGEVSRMFESFGADKIIIDGAVSRKTLCSRDISDATILCTGASYNKDLNLVVEDTRYFCNLLTLPELENKTVAQAISDLPLQTSPKLFFDEKMHDIGNQSIEQALQSDSKTAQFVFIPGALSDRLLEPVLRSNLKIDGTVFVVRDSSKILLTPQNYERLLIKKGKISVLKSVNLVAVTINPFSAYGFNFDKNLFFERMSAAVDLPVINVEED